MLNVSFQFGTIRKYEENDATQRFYQQPTPCSQTKESADQILFYNKRG
jgi:hypothetical protein